MKLVYESNDMVMFVKASDGQGHEIWGKARVAAIIGDSVHLDNGMIVTSDKVLPIAEAIHDLHERVVTALNSGNGTYGFPASK